MELGFHARDLAGPDFTTVFHGILTPTDRPATLTDMARTAQTLVVPGSVISYSTAALILGVPLPARYEQGAGLLAPNAESYEPGFDAVPSVRTGASLREGELLPLIHLRRTGARGATRRRGTAVHRGDPGPTIQLGKLRLSAPSEVLRELAQTLPLFDLVAAIEALYERPSGSVRLTPEELDAHLDRVRGLRGSPALRKAWELAIVGARSPAESVMRLILTDAGLPAPVPNFEVVDPVSGRRRYLDLAWPSARFALEYDGDGHRVEREQWRADEERRDQLAAQGWTLSRANGSDLWRPRRILLRVGKALGEQGLVVPTPEHLARYSTELPGRKVSLRIDPRYA